MVRVMVAAAIARAGVSPVIVDRRRHRGRQPRGVVTYSSRSALC